MKLSICKNCEWCLYRSSSTRQIRLEQKIKINQDIEKLILHNSDIEICRFLYQDHFKLLTNLEKPEY